MSLKLITSNWPVLVVVLLGCNHSAAPAKRGDSPIRAAAQQQVPSGTSTQTISIQNLADNETYSGAGTGFQLASEPSDSNKVIFGYADPEGPANMRINNQLIVLKHVGSTVLKASKKRQGLGEHVQDTWANDHITVVFDYTTTVVGEGGVGYKGKVTIQMNGQHASFPITGGSGC